MSKDKDLKFEDKDKDLGLVDKDKDFFCPRTRT